MHGLDWWKALRGLCLLDKACFPSCGYVWQKNIFSDTDRTTANTGFCAGGSVDIPLNKKDEESNMGLSIDYSYRMASPLKGTHSIGASFRF